MAFKMKGKSPMMKALIGKQKNLPDHLKQYGDLEFEDGASY